MRFLIFKLVDVDLPGNLVALRVESMALAAEAPVIPPENPKR
jgi:hypothetical protein